MCGSDFEVVFADHQFQMFLTPVLTERHIGLDQGTNNFGMAVVDTVILLLGLEVGRVDLLGNLPYRTEVYYECGMNIHVGLHYT